MDTRFYQAANLDLLRIAQELENVFSAQGYQTQHIGDQRQMIVQLHKGGEIEALVGMQAALTVTLQAAPGGIMAIVGQQQWIDKAAVGVLGMLFVWPLMLTAGIGLFRQIEMENQVYSALDAVVQRLSHDVKIGPIPPQMQEQWRQQFQQQYPPQPQPPFPPFFHAPHPQQQPPMPIACPKCHTPNEAGDAFCYRCGTSLKPEKKTCPECKAEIKPGAAFCSKCGKNVA
jgi:hypothetical protein